MEPTETVRGEIVVRRLTIKDLEPVIALDAKVTGHRREEFFKLKAKQAIADTGIEVSLRAEIDGSLVGFLIARLYYGEFGTLESVAALDTIGVDPDFAGQGVGAALMDQLCTNLRGIGIQRLQTEVRWDNLELISFFHREGFRPAPRLCLDLDLTAARGY